MQTDHDESPILSEHVIDSNTFIGSASIISTEMERVLKNLVLINADIPCKELQLSIMDATSLLGHLDRFIVDGPSAPFIEVPLEDSEVEDEGKFWEEPEDGGQSEGDKMMSSEAE